MNTIVWVFHNVMPWVGVYFAVMTIIFLIALIVDLLRWRKSIHDHSDVTETAFDLCVIVNIVLMLIIKGASLLIERIVKKLKSSKEKT